MTKRTLLILPILFSFPAQAELSASCIYLSITEAHDAMHYCDEPIDLDRESRYESVRYLLKEFINEKARREERKIDSGYDEKVRKHVVEGMANSGCQNNPMFPILKAIFFEYTGPSGGIALRDSLKKRADPDEGDCF